MAAYNVSVLFTEVVKDLPASQREEVIPEVYRVSASNATRAQSKLINDLKSAGTISSKSEISILEAKVVA